MLEGIVLAEKVNKPKSLEWFNTARNEIIKVLDDRFPLIFEALDELEKENRQTDS